MSMIRNAAVAITLLVGAGSAHADTWPFDLATSGEDVVWMSPTAVDPDSALFEGSYTISQVIATVSILGPIDVTGFIDPELLSGSASAEGPAPLTLVELGIVFPEPPEEPAVVADLFLSLDDEGFGNLAVSNITLGSLDLGFPFGIVDILGLAISGEIPLNGVTPSDPNDINGDGAVDVQDLVIVITGWGECPAGLPCPGDVNQDGFVDVLDLVSIITGWG